MRGASSATGSMTRTCTATTGMRCAIVTRSSCRSSRSAHSGGSVAHDEKGRPITKETNVRYLDWVASRRAYVDKTSAGRIGYIHLPDTAMEGNRELFKYFYPLVGKDALIIDDRYN